MRLTGLGVQTALICASSLEAYGAVLVDRQADTQISASAYRRRGYHSSAVIGNWVYIDGGEVSYDSGGSITRQFSNSLLAIDLSNDWSNNSVSVQSISKPSGAASLVSGGLWVNDKTLYTGFAGRKSRYDKSNGTPNRRLWSFKPDGRGAGSWTAISDSDDASWSNLVRPFSPLVASGNGAGYMLGGWQVNASETNSGVNPSAISGLLKYNFTTKKVSNDSVTGVYMAGVNQMGSMQYVPNFGPEGIFVAMGGDQVGKVKVNNDALLNMTYVQIYDPKTGKWYEQKTSGNPPEPRKEFCVSGVASSSDKSYEIFLYAGWAGKLGRAAVPFDAVYILSLPGFHWFKADYEAANPRHALSCNAVGGGQVLAIGGVNTTQVGPADFYDAVFNTQDQFTQGLAIFNMSALRWESSYVAKPPAYTQPALVSSWYSSNPRKPTFTDSALSAVIDVENFSTDNIGNSGGGPSNSTRPDDTPPSSSPSSHTGAIIGGVVGGVVGLLVIVTAVIMFLRRRNHVAVETHPPVYEQTNAIYRHEQLLQPSELGAVEEAKPPRGAPSLRYELLGNTSPEPVRHELPS